MKIRLFVLLFLFLFALLSSPIINSEAIGILLVVGKTEISKAETIQKVVEWKISQGYEAWVITADHFADSDQLKTYLKVFYQDHPNMAYVILPPKSFAGTIKCEIDGKEYEFISDKYFENLDDDALFQSEIIISRASIDELLDISLRQNRNQLTCNIGFPMINYDRWACIPGECLQYVKCDASHLGDDIKRQFNRKNIKTYTFYELEGIQKSFLKPDFALTEENITKYLEQSNIIWYLNTSEPLKPQPEGYVLYSVYCDFNRAIWTKDENNDNLITDPELDIQPFFQFSDKKSNYNRIAFLPLFDNDKMNLNLFSSLIGINPIEGCLYVPDDGTGLGASVFSLYRLVMENLLNGKTVGESIQVFQQYTKLYPSDEYKQQYFALGLFVRGDPTFTIQDLLEKAKLDISPSEIETTSKIFIPRNQIETEITIRNSGSGNLKVSIEFNERVLMITPRESTVEPGKEQMIKIKIQASPILISLVQVQSTPKKKQSTINIKSNARNKVLKVIWVGI